MGQVFSAGGSVRLPIAGGTVNSEAFEVPKGCEAITVNVPSLAGTTTLKIQSLAWAASDTPSEVWADVSFFYPADGSFVALDGIPESAATTIPTTLTGGGWLRFVASTDQSAAPVQVPIVYHMR